MSTHCDCTAPESFVLSHVSNRVISKRYVASAFQDYVRSHPCMRFCPGKNCKRIVMIHHPVQTVKRCQCTSCKIVFW